MLPSLNTMSLTLRVELVLRSVNLKEPTLNAILKNSPHLETLYMFGSVCSLIFDINLKKFKLVACAGTESVSLSDFDLKYFQCRGQKIEVHLTNLSIQQNWYGEKQANLCL